MYFDLQDKEKEKGRKKLKQRRIGFGGVHCINLAQGRDQWQALVNTVTNLRVP
jgi:hypothetical protein